jgi:hypothetical protein
MDTFFEISESGNTVRIEPIEFHKYDSDIDWDKNWIKTKIFVKGGHFSGEYIADIMSIDFETFKQSFSALYDNLSGVSEFYDLEGYLNLKIKGDGIGHFEMQVTACDRLGVNASHLHFSMQFDQTYIKRLSNELNKITEEFPVSGNLN